ncbi:MAG: Cof-type HAD-IIB family hydrolase [Ardenticatenia bacterium]|nr:MAG: Cof-type HAD-IIB family hydrolase [Ardenticatenia bacterium]
MRIQLIALDLDGTLVGRSLLIPERNRAALRAAMAQGCRVTIATGRSLVPTDRFARELGLNAPLILYQGALIQDYRDGTVIHRQTLPLPLAREIAIFATARQLAIQVHAEDGPAFTPRTNPLAARMQAITGVPATQVEDLVTWLERPPLKILFLETPEGACERIRELRERFGERINVVRSHDLIVEVTAPQVSKGHALAILAAHLGIPRAATLAMGDHDNDAEMLAWAGLGIAMPKASAAARNAADMIAPSQPSSRDGHDEAVAWAVERFVLDTNTG